MQLPTCMHKPCPMTVVFVCRWRRRCFATFTVTSSLIILPLLLRCLFRQSHPISFTKGHQQNGPKSQNGLGSEILCSFQSFPQRGPRVSRHRGSHCECIDLAFVAVLLNFSVPCTMHPPMMPFGNSTPFIISTVLFIYLTPSWDHPLLAYGATFVSMTEYFNTLSTARGCNGECIINPISPNSFPNLST